MLVGGDRKVVTPIARSCLNIANICAFEALNVTQVKSSLFMPSGNFCKTSS
jgi:hypothetical protein